MYKRSLKNQGNVGLYVDVASPSLTLLTVSQIHVK